MDLLVSLYIACILLAEVMGSKTVPLTTIADFHLNASVAILLLPLIFSINDVVTEVYGPERTRSIVRSGLYMIVLLVIFSAIAVHLPPSKRFEKTNPAYMTVFSNSIRFSLASLTAFALAEFSDVYIFTKLRKRLGKKALWFRNNVSNILAQLIDTVLFMTLAFYAFDKSFANNAAFLAGIIIPYWLLKCSMSVLVTPGVYWGVRWLKQDKR